MKQYNRPITILVAAVMTLVLVAGAALAGDRDRDHERYLTVIDDDGKRYEIVLDDRHGIEVIDDDGEVVADVDFEDMEEAIDKIVGRAMVGVGRALQSLSEMDLDIRWDADDSHVFLALDDNTLDFDIDIDEIMDGVGEALESLEDMEFEVDIDDWDRHRHRDRHVIHEYDDEDEVVEELREEMDRLRDEISDLKKQLARTKRSRH